MVGITYSGEEKREELGMAGGEAWEETYRGIMV